VAATKVVTVRGRKTPLSFCSDPLVIESFEGNMDWYPRSF